MGVKVGGGCIGAEGGRMGVKVELPKPVKYVFI